MTIKEIEILASSDLLMDMLVYARCQIHDLGSKFNLPDLRYEHTRLYDTLKSIQTEVKSQAPLYEPKYLYRAGRPCKNIKL